MSKAKMTPMRADRLMSVSEMRDMDIFGVGNPVVDITAQVDDEFLKSYNLPKNSTLLAEIQHEGLNDDVLNKYDIEYSAGDCVQNALRYSQWIVGKNNSIATFIGAVGNDYFGRILAEKVKLDGLQVKYMINDGSSTGSSAVLFTDDNRNKTIVTNLGASKKFDKNFLNSNFWFCERSRVIVVSGHMLSVSPDSVINLAKHAHEWGKDFVFNMGAPYVVHKSSSILIELLQYVDFLFCSAEEAIALATMKGYHTKELKAVAKLIADEPKVVYSNPRIPNHYKCGRIVIVTQRDKPVLLANSKSKDIKEFPVTHLEKEELKDTLGAGDALIGGFLAMYIDGRPIDVCIKCGIYCATECCKQPGCTLPKIMNFDADNL